MRLNPEFKRNILIEMTTQRLLVMPFILIALTALVSRFSAGSDHINILNFYSLVILGFMTIFWGAHAASESIMVEVNGLTWDAQRMSGLGPWSMTWGKLFGSTSYVWYGGIFCIIFFFITVWDTVFPAPFKSLAYLILTALLAQSLSLLASLVIVRKSKGEGFGYGTRMLYLWIALIAGSVFLNFGVSEIATEQRYLWFGSNYIKLDFVIASMAIFYMWSVFGVYRLMSEELRIRLTFMGWLIFVVFAVFYVAGFFTESTISGRIFEGFADQRFSFYLAAYAAAALLAYAALFSEKKDPVVFRRLLKSAKGSSGLELMSLVPCWAVTVPVVALIALVGEATVRDMPGGAFLTLLFFFLRDVFLVLFLNLSRKKRADMMAVVFLILLYGVIPGLLHGTPVDALTFLFWPSVGTHGLLSLGAAFLEAALFGWLFFMRWKKSGAEPLVGQLEE